MPTLPLHDHKRVLNRPAYTPERKSTLDYSHTSTLPPLWTLPAACTRLQTTFCIALEPQTPWLKKKAQKCGNTASPCLDKLVLRRGGGGVGTRPRGETRQGWGGYNRPNFGLAEKYETFCKGCQQSALALPPLGSSPVGLHPQNFNPWTCCGLHFANPSNPPQPHASSLSAQSPSNARGK